MASCLYCNAALVPSTTDSPTSDPRRSASRDAYDPQLGRLWRICGECARWNPIPLEARWETLERLETDVREKGRVVLTSEHLALHRVGDEEVVRIGEPTLTEWGAWRYGTRLAPEPRRRGLLERALRALPPAPLEGYDPYGLSGPMGGVGGTRGPTKWLASPFLDQARPLTLAFSTVPFARICPSCSRLMPLHPWDFAHVTFHITSGSVAVESTCGSCARRVQLDLRDARPAIRMGLAILDTDETARTIGDQAGAELEGVGGSSSFLHGLGRLEASLGEMDRIDRIGLGISLDLQAESEALEAEWSRAEELASIMDGELTDVPGFREFRARVLGGLGGSGPIS